jgi:[ribosomal protein S18]-alanine N-acetyltransferase
MSSDCDSFVFRRMMPEDLDRVIEIARMLPQAPDWPRAAYVAAIETTDGSEDGLARCAFVAVPRETGAVAGFIVASRTPPEAELEIVAVAPETQRRGVARCLTAVLAARLRTGNVTEVTLEVRASNYQALALYYSVGFAEIGRRPRYYADPVEDAVLMRMNLR